MTTKFLSEHFVIDANIFDCGIGNIYPHLAILLRGLIFGHFKTDSFVIAYNLFNQVRFRYKNDQDMYWSQY